MDSVKHKIQSAFAGVALKNWRQAFFSVECNSEWRAKCHMFFFKEQCKKLFHPFSLPSSLLPSFPTYLQIFIIHLPSPCGRHKDENNGVLALSSYYQVKQLHLQTIITQRPNEMEFAAGTGEKGFSNNSQHPAQGQVSIRASPPTPLFNRYFLAHSTMCYILGRKHLWKSVRSILWPEHAGGERWTMSLSVGRDNLKYHF